MSFIKISRPTSSFYSRTKILAFAGARKQTITMASASTFYDFVPKNNANEEFHFKNLQNKVVLIVNVASKCGFTSQYEGLEALYKSITKQYPDQFTILGFPCNQFGGQEPGTNAEILTFCSSKWDVTFPIMAKINVNGDDADPVYKWLTSQKSGILGISRIKWNFEKFLVGRNGQVVERWASPSGADSLEKAIRAELEKKA